MTEKVTTARIVYFTALHRSLYKTSGPNDEFGSPQRRMSTHNASPKEKWEQTPTVEACSRLR